MNETSVTISEPTTQNNSAVVAVPAKKKNKNLWRLDLLIFLSLVGAALPLRFAATRGDLWADESDYALASTQGFAANRMDRRNDAAAHKALIASRHFHPPLTVYMVGLARQWGTSERTLRTPFVLAGGLTVGLVYLCGLSLFGARREIGAACAILVLAMPIEIRFLAHIVPWALITPCLTALLWTLLNFTQSRRPSWLIGTGALLGLLFTLSEMIFPTLLVVAFALAIAAWPDWKNATKRRKILQASGIGIATALIIALVLWPAGLLGDSLEMLHHYMGVSSVIAPVKLAGVDYRTAPKWAYAYYYWHDYKPYLLLYAGGAVAFLLLAAFRKLSRAAVVLALFAAFFLAVAHRAHILGPQYLVHCLPLLSLLTGLGFLCVSLLNRYVALVPIVFVCGYILQWKPYAELRDSEDRAAISRWPAAAQYLKTRWKPGDKLLIGPQPEVVARWYMRSVTQIPVRDSDVRMLPQYLPKPRILQNIANGEYRFIIVSSTVAGGLTFDSQIRQMMASWPIVYKSDEGGNRVPRLLIYERPAGLDTAHPQPIPPIGKVGPMPTETIDPNTEE